MQTILDEAIERYDPKYVIAMFSGGHDSLVATHIASRHKRFSFALHINTGIGIEDTRDFVRETCEDWKIELQEVKASEYVRDDGKPDPQIYEQIVMEYGFPGVAQHDKMYIRLKERPLRLAIRQLDRNRKDKTLLVTGVRRHESVRRMRHVKQIQVWEGTKIWVAPEFDFHKKDVLQYMDEYQLRANDVVNYLHKSGECLCGAYAHKGEKQEIGIFYPEMKSYIDELETKVFANGFPWGWEDDPPDWYVQWLAGQQFIEGFEPSGIQMMCTGCEHALLSNTRVQPTGGTAPLNQGNLFDE